MSLEVPGKSPLNSVAFTTPLDTTRGAPSQAAQATADFLVYDTQSRICGRI